MLTRIRPRAVVDAARQDILAPVDVVNLITTARFESYRWYGLLVYPALAAVGARVLWMARSDESLAGERQAEKLLLVRYPSHRHFLAMTLNPYYLAINALREAGVKRLEASFTHASHADAQLQRRHRLVGVHFSENVLDDVVAVAGQAGWELMYATSQTAALGFLDPPRDTDPHPLTFGRLALFAPRDDDLAGVAAQLADVAGDCSVQVYRRETRGEYRPTLMRAR